MAKIVWDSIGERIYETGVDQGVLYPKDTNDGSYPSGVPWNGLISVSENPTGAEANPQYADNIKYLNLISAEEFGATIEAFTYPDEFAACDGSAEMLPGVMFGQQPRSGFGFVYRTIMGNDAKGNDLGYKLHLIYDALATPSEKSYNTVNETPEAMTFSWEITTTPVKVTGYKSTACLTIESRYADVEALALLEEQLFGRDASLDPEIAAITPNLPLPDAVIDLLTPGDG